MASDDSGARRGPGQYPGQKEFSGGNGEGPTFGPMTAEEVAAINLLLQQRGAWWRSASRAVALAWGALKIAGAMALAAGLVAGYADGNEMDEVGCTVARQTDPTVRVERAGKSRDDDDEGSCSLDCSSRLENDFCPKLGKQCALVLGLQIAEFSRRGWGETTKHTKHTKNLSQEEIPMGRDASRPVTERGRTGTTKYTNDTKSDGVVEMLAGIHREIAAVRTEHQGLRSAKERLERMLAGGFFEFTKKVDATSFKILCTILAEGDVAKAGRRLEIGDSMMRYILDQWRERGEAYRAMLELVRWRKKVGRKEKVPLNEAILQEKADAVDYPGLLSDVLDGLLSMTGENWEERCEDLAELVRGAVRRR